MKIFALMTCELVLLFEPFLPVVGLIAMAHAQYEAAAPAFTTEDVKQCADFKCLSNLLRTGERIKSNGKQKSSTFR